MQGVVHDMRCDAGVLTECKKRSVGGFMDVDIQARAEQ